MSPMLGLRAADAKPPKPGANPWSQIMPELSVKSRKPTELIDITNAVRQAVAQFRSNAVLLFVPHTTAGITINENADPDVVYDMEKGLDRLVSREAGYRHAEGNSAAHIKSTLVGPSLLVPVRDGQLLLGQWQGIYFCEFDGPRTRRVMVHPLAAAQ